MDDYFKFVFVHGCRLRRFKARKKVMFIAVFIVSFDLHAMIYSAGTILGY